jgi:hypothetical protein
MDRPDRAYVDVHTFDADLIEFEAKIRAALPATTTTTTSTEVVREVLLVDASREPFGYLDDDGRTEEEMQDEVERGFERFVDLLLGSLRSVQSLLFSYVDFGPDSWFLRRDVERLFGEALPALVTEEAPLATLKFDGCVLPTSCVASFARRIASSSERALSCSRPAALRELRIHHCDVRAPKCVSPPFPS